MSRPTFVEIDLSAVAHNLRALRGVVGPDVEIIGIVKADAYGHGAAQVARVLEAEGVTRLAVALVEEAVELRDAGLRGRILVLGALFANQAEEIIAGGFEAVVSDMALARALDAAARRQGRIAPVHLKFDVGMGRIGFLPAKAEEIAKEASRASRSENRRGDDPFPHCRRAGRGRHPRADIDLPRCSRAVRSSRHPRAALALRQLRSDSPSSRLHLDAVRPGIALYGGFAPSETPAGVQFRQAMTLKTRVALLREMPVGATISYGCTFRTRRPSRIAVLPVGYADGLPRAFSNRGNILIRGVSAPIVGRVCMDLTMADVTDIPGVSQGDEVVLYGRQGNAELLIVEIAAGIGTIAHELMTGLTRRVPRVYLPL